MSEKVADEWIFKYEPYLRLEEEDWRTFRQLAEDSGLEEKSKVYDAITAKAILVFPVIGPRSFDVVTRHRLWVLSQTYVPEVITAFIEELLLQQMYGEVILIKSEDFNSRCEAIRMATEEAGSFSKAHADELVCT